MIRLYESIYDGNRDFIDGRSKLFINKVDGDGNIVKFGGGIGYVPIEPGTLLIVDDYLIEQVDKLKFINNQLEVKEGMTIDVPQLSETEIKRQELLKQLAELG